jgi:CheY-like chemotaxis protein
VVTEAQPAKQAKLLVVEDDALIRMLLADMLGEVRSAYSVAVEAGSIDEALEATHKTDFDLAILDADLKGRSVLPAADALVARDIGSSSSRAQTTGCSPIATGRLYGSHSRSKR